MSTHKPTQTIGVRPLRDDADFWRVRSLLVETVPITPPGFNWDVRQWDGWRFYEADPDDTAWKQHAYLWETGDGELVGAAHSKGRGDVYFEVHPDYRRTVEEDMLVLAEERFAQPGPDGGARVVMFVWEYDLPRRLLLERRGYEKLPHGGMIRRMRFGNQPLATPAIAHGYTLRTVRPGDMADCQRLADLLNAAFERDSHNAEEYHNFARLAPCYRSDLDLVAVAPDGTFAAYVGIPYDETNRRGIYEPVCTHPAHRRQGLARTLMLEGLRRLKTLGAADVTVETGDAEAANALYDSIGFTEAYRGAYWRKRA